MAFLMRDGVQVQINGEEREVPANWTIDELLGDLGLSRDQVAVELNREILKRDTWSSRVIRPGDEIEIVHFVGGGEVNRMSDKLKIAGREFSSRLFVGTGKYETFEVMKQALEASGSEVVTAFPVHGERVQDSTDRAESPRPGGSGARARRRGPVSRPLQVRRGAPPKVEAGGIP